MLSHGQLPPQRAPLRLGRRQVTRRQAHLAPLPPHLLPVAPLQQQPLGHPQFPFPLRRTLATAFQQLQRFPLELLRVGPITLVDCSLLTSPVYDMFCVREIGGRSVARLIKGEGTAAAKRWFKTQATTLDQGRIDQLVVVIEAEGEGQPAIAEELQKHAQ